MTLALVASLLSPSGPQAGIGKVPAISTRLVPQFSTAERRRLLEAGLPGVAIGRELAGPTTLSFLTPGSANGSLTATGSMAFTNENGGVAQLFDLTSAGQGIGQLKATFRVAKGATYALLFVGRSTISSAIYAYGAGTTTWGTGEASIVPGSSGFVVGVTAKANGTATFTIGPKSGHKYGTYCEIQRIEITRL